MTYYGLATGDADPCALAAAFTGPLHDGPTYKPRSYPCEITWVNPHAATLMFWAYRPQVRPLRARTALAILPLTSPHNGAI